MKYRIRIAGQTIFLSAYDIRHLEWCLNSHRRHGGLTMGETVTQYCRITEVADRDDDRTKHLLAWGIFDDRGLMVDRLKQAAIYCDRVQAASYCDDGERVESVYVEYGGTPSHGVSK